MLENHLGYRDCIRSREGHSERITNDQKHKQRERETDVSVTMSQHYRGMHLLTLSLAVNQFACNKLHYWHE